jgi:hypothetical protein
MDLVKEAFQKVREDMDFLKQEVNSLRKQLFQTNERMVEICDVFLALKKEVEESKNSSKENSPTPPIDSKNTQNSIKTPLNTLTSIPTHNPTHNPQNPTNPTHNPTHNYLFNAPKGNILPISTGNRGVPTDKQTNRQTNQQTQNCPKKEENSFQTASEVLDSLDSIKKELRLKFKRLTEQEFLVFSTLYQQEEEEGSSDYRTLSTKLTLSESSIRDYIGRLIKKGVPILKTKLNNKNIQLNLSKDLRKIATLSTIMRLRTL